MVRPRAPFPNLLYQERIGRLHFDPNFVFLDHGKAPAYKCVFVLVYRGWRVPARVHGPYWKQNFPLVLFY